MTDSEGSSTKFCPIPDDHPKLLEIHNKIDEHIDEFREYREYEELKTSS